MTFEVAGGPTVTVTAEPGDSVMSVAVRAGVRGVVGECGGELSCATCHVKLLAPSLFPPPSVDEQDLLEILPDRDETSRLGCQLRIDERLSELSVGVPES